jgi:auxin responsive GH3 family protein
VQRDKGHLGNLMISILRHGAFDQLSDLAIKNGTSAIVNISHLRL